MLFGTAVGWAMPAERAWAQAGDAARATFEVPAGPLEDALNRFARLAGITLSFDPALVRGKQADALSGSLTVTEGLAALLSAHRLEAVRSTSGAYLVQPLASALAGDHSRLPAVIVTASAERADGPVGGYVAQRSATASKMDAALIETPHAVTVIAREQMDDQAVQTAEQSLRYTAGVLIEVTGYDPRYSSLTVRGFAPVEFFDGLRLLTAGIHSGWPSEPQGLERVELLKGPGAALYGSAASGGVLSMVSKRPTQEAVREVGISAGNHDRYQGSFDLGGSLNASDDLLFRLNGVFRNSGGQTDFGRDDRAFIAPALTWKPSSRTSITLLADVTRDRITPKSWWPDGALLTPNPNGRIPVSRFIGEPGLDRYKRDTFSFTALLEHRLSDNWTFHQDLRYSDFKLDYRQIYGSAFQSDLRTLDRSVLYSQAKGRSFIYDDRIEGHFRSGSIAHTLLIGMAYQAYRGQQTDNSSFPWDVSTSNVPPLDAVAPIYGTARDASGSVMRDDSRMRQTGLYARDQMRTGPWTVDLALRYDRTRGAYDDHNTQRRENATTLSSQARKLTYNAGLLYLTEGGLAPYINYSTAFTPQVGVTPAGDIFQPETSRQLEVGLKYQPTGSNMLFTLAAFDLDKRNVLSLDPTRTGSQLQMAQVRSRGLEIEGKTELTRQLKLLASYTYLDARVPRTNIPEQVDKRPLQTARNTASLWLDYRFGSQPLQGWSLGGGVRYVGKVPASVDNSRFNPAYTVVDAALRYERGPYSFSLNASNLFNKTYVAGLGQFFGQSRTLQAKAVYRW